YVESAAIGLLAGLFAAAERLGEAVEAPPATTALGALLGHITGGADASSFQPMNVNFGLFPDLDESHRDHRGRPLRGKARKPALVARAREELGRWLGGLRLAA